MYLLAHIIGAGKRLHVTGLAMVSRVKKGWTRIW